MSSNSDQRSSSKSKLNSRTATTTSMSQSLTGLKRLASGAQFYWYLTLLSTLYSSILCILNSFIRGSNNEVTIGYYSMALSSILTTYLIIMRQTYKYKPLSVLIGQIWHLFQHLSTPNQSNRENQPTQGDTSSDSGTSAGTGVERHSQLNPKYSNNILRDENAQYLLFAFAHWLFASPSFGAINSSVLYSFTIYAFFHACHYTYTNIIPLVPNISKERKAQWTQVLQYIFRLNHERSRMVAANSEIFLVTYYITPLIKIVLRLISGRFWSAARGETTQFWFDFKSVILFFVTIIFLRARFLIDKYTRTQVQGYDANLLRVVASPIAGTGVERHSQLNPKYSNNILRDENAQYLLFAFAHWLFASPSFGAINSSVLYSFTIYAFFHACHYTYTNIIPLVPNISKERKTQWTQVLQYIFRLNHERSRMVAANSEIFLVTYYITPLIKIVLRLISGRFWSAARGETTQFWFDFKSVILFFVTIIFLRARFLIDKYTRTQVQGYDANLLRVVASPMFPAPLRNTVLNFRQFWLSLAKMVSVI
ncbi:hypothetical protein JL09_g310 [Pichia kudriavzevii]|uniref:Uncharacterized protein n=1 Tax=Pichia kudriavzevii TaxID=4909 RepID=A0A099P6E6_PICKU|nr:hypothetical protein JL09_g310 [Pichia kudriavzevii]